MFRHNPHFPKNNSLDIIENNILVKNYYNPQINK